MFDIAWSELLVIGVVALIVIGPKELPGVLRAVGQWMGKIRKMASEFQGQFQEAMREAEMADLQKDVQDLNKTASDLTNFNPLESTQKDIEQAFNEPASAGAPEPASPATEAAPAPVVDISVPLPEAPASVSESDFVTPEPVPQKQAGSGA